MLASDQIFAVIGVWLGRRLVAAFRWRPPVTLLLTGLAVGCLWAFCFNAILGARFGVFYYGRVIGELALWPGTRHQYPSTTPSRWASR